ncbi:hypothetical protein ABKN59_002554 [Abortiporus biennis]
MGSSSDSDSSSGYGSRGHKIKKDKKHKKDKKDKKDKDKKYKEHGQASGHGAYDVHTSSSAVAGHGYGALVAAHGAPTHGVPQYGASTFPVTGTPGYAPPAAHGHAAEYYGTSVLQSSYPAAGHSPAPYGAPPVPGFGPPVHGSPGYSAPSPAYGAPSPFGAPTHGTPPFGTPGFGTPPAPYGAPPAPYGGQSPFGYRDAPDSHGPSAPPSGTPPPSGFRVALATGQPFPTQQAGQPASFDADGRSPVFIGSAIIGNSVHPCKIAPHLNPPVRVGYGGREVEHQGRYDLLPFTPFNMEWVPTSKGKVPSGRRPVEGGYEDHGGKLYHALVTTHGVQVPGKTGEHLGGANCAFGGSEIAVKDGYSILCWK